MNNRRLKRFDSAISGFSGSFLGRNNDINGYWALGIVYSIAKENNSNLVYLDLLNKQTSPIDDTLQTLTSKYRNKFKQLLEANKLNLISIQKAVLKIEFDVLASKKHLRNRYTYGQPYTCTIRIVDDIVTVIKYVKIGWCAPHCPERNLRRVG